MSSVVAGVEAYDAVFAAERCVAYPDVEAFERRCGAALDPARLLEAARVLACPVKASPPNWQHGRVLYSLTRSYLAQVPGPVTLLDIGTAKGFSALCLQWALEDAGDVGQVYSVDVIDPLSRLNRNTVADVDGPRTLPEILAPWPSSRAIQFQQATGRHWLEHCEARVHLAFVDGKHTTEAVSREGQLLAARQVPGDFVMFDDVQIPGVADAVKSLSRLYTLEYLTPVPARRIYALGVRR